MWTPATRRHHTIRSFALPDVSTELAGLSGAQTFDGDKTLAGAPEASGSVATMGTGVGTATSRSDNVRRHQDPHFRHRRRRWFRHDGTKVINKPMVAFANGVTVVGMPQANLTALGLGLGGAVANAWNRLSVNTPAGLLKNAGAGIEATVNKNAPANDAAFAFKTGFRPGR